MQMRPRRATGRTDAGDTLSAHHQVALFDQKLGAMRIARDEAITVVNLDAFAVGGVNICINHFAAGGCVNGRPGFSSKVHALVKR